MMNFLKIYLWIAIPILLLNSKNLQQGAYKTISHEVLIEHPGEKEPVRTILNEIQNEDGLPIQYNMDVYSVICLEEVCKIIPVKLFWRNTGAYQKYELAKGETLEKYEADLFEPEDYVKLQSILANDNSPFKEVYIDEILTVPDEHGNEDIDAVSGATALELDEKDTVPGAALTCYTLWHWANGDVISKIKTQTGKSASESQLQNFILDRNNAYFHIALDALKSRELYIKPFINAVIQKLLIDSALLRPGFKYIDKATNNDYLDACKSLFLKGQKEQKLGVLQSIRQTKQDIPQHYLDTLSLEVSNLSSYQEVSLLLELMEDKNPNSPKVIENTLPLLNDDFLVARRVYWFLKNQKLNDAQQNQLYLFQEKNKEKL